MFVTKKFIGQWAMLLATSPLKAVAAAITAPSPSKRRPRARARN